MRRYLKRGTPVALFLLITFLYPLLAPPAHRIDESHFDQIRDGMTLDEVESRFGASAGSYDWAVPENPSIWLWDVPSIWLWDVSTGLKINEVSFSKTISSVTVNRAPDDAIVWSITYAEPPQKLYANVVNFTVKHASRTSRTWTSRHGTCTITFDQQERVVSKSGWGETRLEPPWHNWRKWFSK